MVHGTGAVCALEGCTEVCDRLRVPRRPLWMILDDDEMQLHPGRDRVQLLPTVQQLREESRAVARDDAHGDLHGRGILPGHWPSPLRCASSSGQLRDTAT